MNEHVFDTFALNANKYEININNYLLTQGSSFSSNTDDTQCDEFYVYREPKFVVSEPHICLWEYGPKPEIINLLSLQNKKLKRKFIEAKLNKKPKGFPRIIFRELMYTVTKFCISNRYSVEQTGAVLSQFYLTHLYFTSALEIGAEKLYEYFKALQMCHSLPFPPRSIKLFNLEEIKNNMVYFCRLYLRNLPIIRFMCLPNFSLCVNHELEPDMKPDKKKKKKKGKKDKKGKKKGKKK